jgi:TusA-related sulfurtransferase
VSEFVLDARRLLCPMPVIRAQDRVQSLKPGDVLKVICTDPGALHDIPAWCRMNGHRLLESDIQGREIVIRLEVGEQPS